MPVVARTLLGPGPTNPYPEATAALAAPLLGHLDPLFLALLDETCDRLRAVYRTENRRTLPLSATGGAGMEAAFVNTVAAIAAGKGDALFLADCVTSLAGIELAVDDWAIDLAYSGTQKCIGVAPRACRPSPSTGVHGNGGSNVRSPGTSIWACWAAMPVRPPAAVVAPITTPH